MLVKVKTEKTDFQISKYVEFQNKKSFNYLIFITKFKGLCRAFCKNLK